jgi:hypothetical protein
MPTHLSKTPTKLKVFCSYVTPDLQKAKDIHSGLVNIGVEAWIDRENLLPGQDWKLEINKAIQESHVILILISQHSISREGYYQKEYKLALDIALEKPEGTIYIIPIKLEECELPDKLKDRNIQWLDWYLPDSWDRLIQSLKIRAQGLGFLSDFSNAANDNPATPSNPLLLAKLEIGHLSDCRQATKSTNIGRLYESVGLKDRFVPGNDVGQLLHDLLDQCSEEELTTKLVMELYGFERLSNGQLTKGYMQLLETWARCHKSSNEEAEFRSFLTMLANKSGKIDQSQLNKVMYLIHREDIN